MQDFKVYLPDEAVEELENLTTRKNLSVEELIAGLVLTSLMGDRPLVASGLHFSGDKGLERYFAEGARRCNR